jgi:hypothetical protein
MSMSQEDTFIKGGEKVNIWKGWWPNDLDRTLATSCPRDCTLRGYSGTSSTCHLEGIGLSISPSNAHFDEFNGDPLGWIHVGFRFYADEGKAQ